MKLQRTQHIIHRLSSPPRLRRGTRQRFALGFLALMLAVSAGLPAIAGDSHRNGRRDHSRQEQDVSAEAKRGRKKVVKKTFSSDAAITIPTGISQFGHGPATPYPTTIDVHGFKKARILDVNLTLRGFSHAWSSDVDMLLVAPDGRNTIVLSDVGSDFSSLEAAVSNITIKLDDEAAAGLPEGDGHPLTAGSFQPADTDSWNQANETFFAPAPVPSASVALAKFDGINPNGQWRLFVVDDSANDVGSIAGGWTLEITAKTKKRQR